MQPETKKINLLFSSTFHNAWKCACVYPCVCVCVFLKRTCADDDSKTVLWVYTRRRASVYVVGVLKHSSFKVLFVIRWQSRVWNAPTLYPVSIMPFERWNSVLSAFVNSVLFYFIPVGKRDLRQVLRRYDTRTRWLHLTTFKFNKIIRCIVLLYDYIEVTRIQCYGYNYLLYIVLLLCGPTLRD